MTDDLISRQVSEGQLLKNYHFVQLTELTDECIERIADAVVKKMSTSNPSVLHMKIKADAEAVKKAMQSAELTLLPAEPEYEGKGFLEFLWNVINPNEMESYLAMYNSKGVPTDG